MALNSNIRNVPLLGNVDLTNFRTDIHNYEGFVKDNSFFLNKRKKNWWRKNVSEGEIPGDITYTADEDYFNLSKGSARIGKISRNYYKLESVEPTEWQQDTTSKIINPLKNTNYIVGGQAFDADEYVIYKIDDDYYICGVLGTQTIKILNALDGSEYASFNIDQALTKTNLLFYKSSNDFYFEKNENKEEEEPLPKTSDIYFSIRYTFYLLNSEIFINVGAKNYIFNLNTKTLIHNRASIILDATTSYFLEGDEADDSEEIFNTGTVHIRFDSSSSSSLYKLEGDLDPSQVELAFQFINVFMFISVANNQLYFTYGLRSHIMGDGGYNYSHGGINGTWSALNYVDSPYYTIAPSLSYLETIDNQKKYQFIIMAFGVGAVFTQIFTLNSLILNIYNYSQKYGIWAINYIEKTAINIAHNYKKLVLIDGEESATGEILAIDGYNNTAIYFHNADKYYKLTIDKADYLEQVAKKVKDYYIFNTTSYENAYFINENRWFCSCDDWNSRFIFISDANDRTTTPVTSRLNNNWQTLNYVVSVSDTIAPYNLLIPTTPEAVAPYSGGTWDGTAKVYTANKELVNTSSWNVGHSLAGYYYATSYTADYSGLAPAYLDPLYTCPIYEDHNGDTVKQSYTVFAPKEILQTIEPTLIKQGTIDADGFMQNEDETKIFVVPADEYSYQETPALLNQNYLEYTNSVLVMNENGAYKLMESSRIAYFVFIYLTEEIADPLKQGDSVFIINGVEYTYKAESNRILDYTGQWVCNTFMMRYIGFSTTMAYFFCEFDKCIYLFEGNNTLRKLFPIEKYTFSYEVFEDSARISTLNVSSINLVLFNMGNACGILYEDQFIILDTGPINTWNIEESTGTFYINNFKYNLNPIFEGGEVIPIEFETQFFGSTDDETNTINDCVYVTLSNLQSLPLGSLEIKAEGFLNDKIIGTDSKKLLLKAGDFNDYKSLLVKFQPKIQECKGFKIYLKTDFELASLKIGTSQGAMNQTSKRI